MAAQIHHAGHGESLALFEDADVFKRADVCREDDVVDGEAHRLARRPRLCELFRRQLAFDDAVDVLLPLLGEGEGVLALHLADVAVKGAGVLPVLVVHRGIDGVVGACTLFYGHAALAAYEPRIVLCQLRHEIFEVAAVKAHMVDHECQRALRPAAEEPDADLHIAAYRDALLGKLHHGALDVIGVRRLEGVLHLPRLHHPIGLQEVVVIAGMQHRHPRDLKLERLHQRVLVDLAVIVKHAVHHAIVIVAEKILHLVPHFGFQDLFHRFPLKRSSQFPYHAVHYNPSAPAAQ